MTTYQEALRTVLQHVDVLEYEDKPLPDCLGQVLARDIYAGHDLPLMDSSGPDGYAVRSADIIGASKNNPAKLDIIEIVRAGILPKNEVVKGAATRIMTGAVLPRGADCVVRFEDTDEPENKNGPNTKNPAKVKIFVDLKPGSNIVKTGANIKKGELVLSKGMFIGPAQLSVLTTLGQTTIRVHRRPVIAVISTGDELIDPGSTLKPGKSFDCNSGTVMALIRYYGGIPQMCGIAKDTRASLLSTIRKGLSADAIITSGGVSKGDYDLMRLILEEVGKLHFARIKMGPGAAFGFGEYHLPEGSRAKSIPMFALSGPPAGCMINFETLVRPAILKMQGCKKLEHPRVEAIAEDAFPGKRSMAFVRWTKLKQENNQYHVKLNNLPDLGPLVSIANANSLTIIPEGEEVEAGGKIQVLSLNWNLDY